MLCPWMVMKALPQLLSVPVTSHALDALGQVVAFLHGTEELDDVL
jgi:hypothetical protein